MYTQKQKQWKNVIRYIKRMDPPLFEINLQNVDQRTWGKWLIQSTNHPKDNQ